MEGTLTEFRHNGEAIDLVSTTSLPNDGKVIADERGAP
jgi:hypothetical protein